MTGRSVKGSHTKASTRGRPVGGAGVAVAVLAALCVTVVASCSSGGDGGPESAETTVPADRTTGPQAPSDRSASRLVDGASGFAPSGHLRIHYEVHGEGEPLVLVNGWSGNTRLNWELTGWIEALTPVRQVIAVEIRGHGDSDKPHDPGAYTYAAMATDVIAVMDHLGVERAGFVGYSLGAFVGARLLGHDADRLLWAVLMGIGDEDDQSLALAPRIAAALRATSPSEITDPEAAAYRAIVDLDPRNDREALAVAALTMWPEGYPVEIGGGGLAEVDVPVLLVNGSNDLPYARTDDALAAAIPGSQLVEIPGADHLSVVVDPRFKDEVLRFLQTN